MKALILTVTSGEGHNSIGRAIKEQLENLNIETKTIDILKGKDWLTSTVVDKGYLFMCKHAKGIYNHVFNKTKLADVNAKTEGTFFLPVKRTKYKTFKEIEEYDPDVVICTHSLPARLMIEMKKEYKNLPKTISILFDFTVHPCWEKVRDIDYLITPNEDFDDILINKGYMKSQLVPLGLPTQRKFSEFLDKREIRKKLGIDENKTTLMIMNGGAGLGKNDQTLKELDKIDADFQIILVNAKNKKMKEKIDKLIANKKFSKPILNLGFVNNVDELMSASDAVLGKTGGVSVNESLNKRLPLIAVHNPVGQELDNINYLLKKDAIIYIDDPKRQSEIVGKYLKNPKKLEKIITNIDLVRKPNASVDIAKFCYELAKEAPHNITTLVGTKANNMRRKNAKKKLNKNKK